MDEVLRKRGRPSKLDEFRNQIGRLSDEEIARMAGCSVANVYMYRRRHNITGASTSEATESSASVETITAPVVETAPAKVSNAAETVAPVKRGRGRQRGSILDRHLDIVGKLPDAEVARKVGCTPTNVSVYRKKNNIPDPPNKGEKTGRRPGRPPKAVEARAEAKIEARPAVKTEAVASEAARVSRIPVVEAPRQPEPTRTRVLPPSAESVIAPRYAYVINIKPASGAAYERVLAAADFASAMARAAEVEKDGSVVQSARLVGEFL
jgi:hypothetical protein